MAPTGSDGTTTDLAEPDTANASSAAAAEAGTDTPFGDWREQLRERVKEIRARKHAVHRSDVDEIALNEGTTAATEEKLEAARAQSAESQSVDELSVQLVEGERASRRADIAGIVDDLLGGPAPEPPAAPEAEKVVAELAPEPTPVPELLEEVVALAPESTPVPEVEEEVAQREPVPVPELEAEEVVAQLAPEDSAPEEDIDEPIEATQPVPDAAPLFQEEPTVFADDPILEIAEEFEHREENALAFEESGDTETELVTAVEAPDEIAAEMEPEIDEIDDEPALPVDDAALPDNSLLAGIPPELRDVEIPTWALPREPSRAPQPTPADVTETASGTTAETAANDEKPDTFLVGEYTTHEGGKRTDLAPPPNTPIPTADLLDQRIGDLAALSEEALAEEEVEIAPPGSLVDTADFEPRDREEAPAASRALPGLFDLEGEPDSEEAGNKPRLFFDEPLVKGTPAEAIDENEMAPATFREEPTAKQEPAELVEDEKPGPIGFFDEQVDEKRPVEEVAEEEPEPVVSFDETVAEEAPARLADAETPAPASTPAEDDGLEWDVDGDLDADLVADARRQHADASAPVSDRVYSAVADGMVLLTIGLVLMIAGASAAQSPVVAFVQAAPVPFIAAWLLFGLVYGVIFVGTCGQTLGKMAMRVRVIGADTFHVGYGRAALRACAYAAATLPAGLGLLPAIKDPEHRGLHDRLTSTRVVKA